MRRTATIQAREAELRHREDALVRRIADVEGVASVLDAARREHAAPVAASAPSAAEPQSRAALARGAGAGGGDEPERTGLGLGRPIGVVMDARGVALPAIATPAEVEAALTLHDRQEARREREAVQEARWQSDIQADGGVVVDEAGAGAEEGETRLERELRELTEAAHHMGVDLHETRQQLGEALADAGEQRARAARATRERDTALREAVSLKRAVEDAQRAAEGHRLAHTGAVAAMAGAEARERDAMSRIEGLEQELDEAQGELSVIRLKWRNTETVNLRLKAQLAEFEGVYGALP